ncbi:hypothetical protein QPK14_00995 [Photorhabdus temperata subsp. temperata]
MKGMQKMDFHWVITLFATALEWAVFAALNNRVYSNDWLIFLLQSLFVFFIAFFYYRGFYLYFIKNNLNNGSLT